MPVRRLILHWESTLKVTVCVLVLTYLSWTFRRNLSLFFAFLGDPEYRACVYHRRNYELQDSSAPLYVTMAHHGRLGNWLFGYASLLGIARANGYIPYFIHYHPLTSFFELKHVRKSHVECLHTVYDDLPCSYQPSMMSLPQGNISIDGYVRSWKYFRFMEEEVRKELRMNENLLKSAKKQFKDLLGNYIAEKRVVISIHVRRGDVLKPEARKLGFCHAPKEYFDNAMRYMVNKFPHSVFLVVSEDMLWCKENIKPFSLRTKDGKSVKVPVVYSVPQHIEMDFAMLTLCDHSVISVGTFGWWGAWLANGHTVYYKGFPLKGTKLDYETNKEDFFPEHWVALSSAGSWTGPAWLVVSALCLSIHQINL